MVYDGYFGSHGHTDFLNNEMDDTINFSLPKPKIIYIRTMEAPNKSDERPVKFQSFSLYEHSQVVIYLLEGGLATLRGLHDVDVALGSDSTPYSYYGMEATICLYLKTQSPRPMFVPLKDKMIGTINFPIPPIPNIPGFKTIQAT